MPNKITGYLIGTFGLATFLLFIIGTWIHTNDPTISFFLSLIASHLIMDKVDKLSSESKPK